MININDIIHIENQAFDIEKDIAVLCIKNYQFNNNAQAFKFEKEKIYSISFAKSVGVAINSYTLKCTMQKHCFKVIEVQDIQTPNIEIKDLIQEQDIQETKYRFEVSGYKPFRKNSQYSEKEIIEAGYDIQELLDKEVITWLK